MNDLKASEANPEPSTPEPQKQEASPKQTEVKPEAKQESEPKRTLRAELRAALREKPEEKPAPAAAQPKPEATQVKPEAPKEPEEAILPPADMSPEEKAEFSKLSPAAQKYVSRRAHETRTDYTKKTMELAKREQEYSQIAGLNLSGLRDEYAKQGLALPTIIENAVAWDRAFRANPQAAALQYLQAWGVDPASLTQGGQPQTASMGQADIDRMVQERVNAALEEEQQKLHVQSRYEAVESFRKSKPLFKDPGTAAQLEAAMDPFVRVAVMQNPSRPAQEILEEAYSKVTSSDPLFRDLLAKIDGRAAAEKAKAEAEAAIQASRSVGGGPGSGTPTIKPKNLREALRLGIAGQLPRA